MSKRAIEAVFQLEKGGKPTKAEYQAAVEAGYIDITPAGIKALRDYQNGICANCGAYRSANLVRRLHATGQGMSDAKLLAECEALDQCYAEAAALDEQRFAAYIAEHGEPDEDSYFDPVESGWVDKLGRP